jgi:hypothetical protein
MEFIEELFPSGEDEEEEEEETKGI